MSFNSILVVDCQYDFIDGSLACGNAENAVTKIIEFINANPNLSVLYSADWHSPKHCSFIENGGTWPVHCVADTHGSALHKAFARDIKNPEQRPCSTNIYHKGDCDDREQYSAFDAKNPEGRTIAQDVRDDVAVCGIASEFCVRESALALFDAGHHVTILADLLGWVDEANHKSNLKELETKGIAIA